MRLSKSFVILLALLPAFIQAQPFTPFRNSSVSFGAGANYYKSSFGAGAEVAFDKWIISTTALRAQLEMNYVTNGASDAMHTLCYGHADLMVDLLSSLRGRNRSERLRSYITIGGGIVHSSLGDNDFCALLGLGGQYRFAVDWRFYVEFNTLVHPSKYDNNNTSTLLAALDFGLVYDIANNPTRSRSRFETQRFANDWFFNIALGACSVNHSEVTSLRQRASLLTPVFEFAIGKRLTTLWQIRLSASGLYAKTAGEVFTYYNLHGDIMIDPIAYFSTENPYPAFSALPYLGAGAVARLDDQANFLIAAAAGVQLVWRTDSRNQLFLDTRYTVTPPRFVKSATRQRIGSVGLVTLLAGYSHGFTPQSFR